MQSHSSREVDSLLTLAGQPMADNTQQSRRGRASSAWMRGVVLSPHGRQRFQSAKQQVESARNRGKWLTQKDLNERIGLSLNTLARILKRELGVDRQSLEILFQSFGLELLKTDHVSPIASVEALSSQPILSTTGITLSMLPCFMVVKPN